MRRYLVIALLLAMAAYLRFQRYAVPPPQEVVAVSPDPAGLSIRVMGLRAEGAVRLALFDKPAGFPNHEYAMRTMAATISDAMAAVSIDELPTGTYALAVFQDLNEDEMLNKNVFGVPQEPYGFSNNVRGTYGPPSFASAAFELSENECEVVVRLQ